MKELEKFSRIYRAEFIKCGIDLVAPAITAPAAPTATTKTAAHILGTLAISGGIGAGIGSYLASEGHRIRQEYENIAFNELMNQLSPYLLGGLGGAIIGSLLAYKNRKYLQGAIIGGGAGLLGAALYKTLYAKPSQI